MIHKGYNEDRVGESAMNSRTSSTAFRYTVRLVGFFNLAYFGVEFAVATAIGSVSLFADSINFLENASVIS